MANLHGGTTVVIEPARLAAFIRDGNGPVVRRMLLDGDKVKIEAKRLAGHKTGNLANHIVKRVVEEGGKPVVLVGVEGVKYALFHHEGTQPHIIRARRAPRLVFYWPKAGRVVAFPQVNHPGTKPNRFLTNALRVLR
jgi:hypothetical protein